MKEKVYQIEEPKMCKTCGKPILETYNGKSKTR